MAELSAEQLSDFRADIGDANNAFSDAEIQRLYVRSGESYEGAILLAIDQLLGNAVKLTDYTSGQSSEKASQVFTNLLNMRRVWVLRQAEASGSNNQVRISGLMPPPRRPKDKPNA